MRASMCASPWCVALIVFGLNCAVASVALGLDSDVKPMPVKRPARIQKAFNTLTNAAAVRGLFRASDPSKEGGPELQLFAWRTRALGADSADSVIVLYAGTNEKGVVALVRTSRPDSIVATSSELFDKNEMFGGGTIRQVGDFLHEGYFEFVVNYFQGFQSESMMLFRYIEPNQLKVLTGVRRDSTARLCFSGWFGVGPDDIDGDGVPEMLEYDYGENKGERFTVVYKWNGEQFVELERRK